MKLTDIVATIARHGIDPLSLIYEHTRQGAELSDPITARWTLYVASCAEFRALSAEWKGKRSVRQHQKDVRTLYADCGERGLLGHCCHTLLPCWDSTDDQPNASDYDGDLFGGAA